MFHDDINKTESVRMITVHDRCRHRSCHFRLPNTRGNDVKLLYKKLNVYGKHEISTVCWAV